MKHVGHFIAGELFLADGGSQILNPTNGQLTAVAAIGTAAEVDRAVAAARAAFPAWSSLGLQHRASVMLDLRRALQDARDELMNIVVNESGKTVANAAPRSIVRSRCWANWPPSGAGMAAHSVRGCRVAWTRRRSAFPSEGSWRSVRLTSRC
jgi:acyl-CoA reductase-like NAD-dependent aldehyde dehydrogenase